MLRKPRIAIFDPYARISTNANFRGILELLIESDHDLTVFTRKSPYIEKIPGVRIIFESQNNLWDRCRLFIWRRLISYELYIGVDRKLPQAAIYASYHKKPLALLSYELSFTDEIGKREMYAEMEASRHICFAVCQDEVRSALLSEERWIPAEKIINIPVAGRGYWGSGVDVSRVEFGLPSDKKLVLYSGSTDEWSILPEIISSSEKWDPSWQLIIQTPFPVKFHLPDNILLIQDQFSPADYARFISLFDVGIAAYRATGKGLHGGKNIQHIGLSSGKISSYLQCGVPVIAIGVGEPLKSLLTSYDCGICLDSAQEIGQYLNRIAGSKEENIRSLFCGHFDLNMTIKPLIRIIADILMRGE